MKECEETGRARESSQAHIISGGDREKHTGKDG